MVRRLSSLKGEERVSCPERGRSGKGTKNTVGCMNPALLRKLSLK